jgi:adenylate cyclase
MIIERDKRKLSAVLSADVKGYSRLMGADEAGTVRTLKEYREIVAELIQRYRGRVVDTPGDNLLAEFDSVVDAVDGAAEVQKQLKLKNDELPEARRMEFRIGINLGDVVDDGENIYGDGINIAARVESLSPAGGICISGTAYDQIGKKLPFGYEYLGEQTVKNIEKPVRVYRVLMEPEVAGKVIGEKRFLGKISRRAAISAIIILVIIAGGLIGWNIYLHQSKKVESASLDKMAYPLPDKPSIAVLPFENIGGDPEQDYIADGITDNIITGLSQVPEMFVIARNSVFTYKGKSVEIRQVSEELGVRYVLEGSVQRLGDRLRINAQLIDATRGHHLWAKSYDRELKDMFALQDEITLKIIAELQVNLTEGEIARIYEKGTDKLEAYLKAGKAQEHFRRFTKDENRLARQMAKEVIDLDPKYPDGYIILGWTHYIDARLGWSKYPKESLARAEELARKALVLDDSQAFPHLMLASIYRMRGQWDEPLAETEHAVSIAPHPENSYHLAIALRLSGRPEESIALFKTAMRTDPIPAAFVIENLGGAYFDAGRYEDALTEFKKLLDLSKKGEFNPEFTHINLAATYAMLGREKEARKQASEVIKINPKFSLKFDVKRRGYKNRADTDRWIDALGKAGLPD